MILPAPLELPVLVLDYLQNHSGLSAWLPVQQEAQESDMSETPASGGSTHDSHSGLSYSVLLPTIE